jgi:plastocyanin
MRIISVGMFSTIFLATASVTSGMSQAENPRYSDVRLHLISEHQPRSASKHDFRFPPAVLWLNPLQPNDNRTAPRPHEKYTVLQKNKMFTPHVLVLPVGSVVTFPNADSFFHNVFSLFNGMRFDLGLYEAGSTKDVTFSREGVSYIFCNIHPQMSAVVISLSTPYYAIADRAGDFRLHDVPTGDYELHVWLEGQEQAELDRFTRRVRISASTTELGEIAVPAEALPATTHTNKFGQPYDTVSRPPY